MSRTRGVSFGKMEQAILTAAGELFDRQGFNQTSLLDIADVVGMARPSLYHYFDNREQILVAGIETLTTARNDLTDSIRSMGPDPMVRLDGLMAGLGDLISINPVWIRILMRDEAALPEETRVRDHESRMDYFELLALTLREGMDSGLIRPRDEHATALTIIAALSGLQGQFTATTVTTMDESTRLIVDIILRGVLVEDPRGGTPIERGLALIREGTEMIRMAGTPRT